MYSFQNITALSEVGPIRHRLYNQLQVAKNVLKGCGNHRENKTTKKEEYRQTIDAAHDMPLPENPKNENEDGIDPQMHRALAHLKYTLLLTNLAELPSKVQFLPIGSDRKIAMLPPLEFMQEVNTSYLVRHHILPTSQEDVYNTDNFAEESIKTMLKQNVAMA